MMNILTNTVETKNIEERIIYHGNMSDRYARLAFRAYGPASDHFDRLGRLVLQHLNAAEKLTNYLKRK